ncbi:hypothetical protein T4E_4155 [Trichinella pseudospiralis]|uniref:Uncharacterized protein n=1 Tax=Trichinella pseudospiralis TaxID=6337 RepID=A0A0V0XEI4_TRIPS|nr:hypothetical protein T4E_4155 [Trichinella pseudospiralis]
MYMDDLATSCDQIEEAQTLNPTAMQHHEEWRDKLTLDDLQTILEPLASCSDFRASSRDLSWTARYQTSIGKPSGQGF